MAQKPGTDVALINAMMNVIISEKLLDTNFIKERTESFDAMADAATGNRGGHQDVPKENIVIEKAEIIE